MFTWRGAGGVAITGDAWSDARGPLVLLQHGGGQTRHAWKGAGEKLGAHGYRAIAFDARGHGDSDWAPDGAYGEDVMVEDLRCVIAALGRPRAALIGASLGGDTGLIAAAEGRIEASALILVDIAPRVEMDGADRVHNFMTQKPEGFASLEEVADGIASYQPQRARRRNLDGLAKNVRLAADGTYRWHWDPRFKPQESDFALRQQRLENCARHLTCPTLLVRGALSDVLSEEGAREFQPLCPHSEYVNVLDAGHMVAGDRNDVFGDALLAFLNRVVRGDGG